MSNNTTPDWMTDEWLRVTAGDEGGWTPGMAREILRLRAELAKVTAERDREAGFTNSYMRRLHKVEAERDAAIRDRNEAVAASESSRRIWEADEESAMSLGKPAKMTLTQWVREFAASEVERFAKDTFADPLLRHLHGCAESRAAELRKPAGAHNTHDPKEQHGQQVTSAEESPGSTQGTSQRVPPRGQVEHEEGGARRVGEPAPSSGRVGAGSGFVDEPEGHCPDRAVKAAGAAPATSFEDWVRSYAVVGDESRKGEATPPADRQPDDLGAMRDAKGLSDRCAELAHRLVAQDRRLAASEKAKAALARVVEIIDGSDGGIRASAADVRNYCDKVLAEIAAAERAGGA